jgi:hypothetical protein
MHFGLGIGFGFGFGVGGGRQCEPDDQMSYDY